MMTLRKINCFTSFALSLGIIACLVYFENSRISTNSLLPVKVEEPSRDDRYRDAYTSLTSDAVCTKNSQWDTYRICDRLPYTKIVCRKGNNADEKRNAYVVPNVVHYVWFGEREMLYYHYMSVRSAAANQQPEKIIFHVDGGPPLGDLWTKLVEEVPCLETRHLDVPETVFGHKIEWILHKTDVARNDILIKEGGIYLDSDVLILRSLDPLRRNAFTMGRSTANSLSNGAMLAKPESKFLQATIDTYKEFSAEKFSGTKQAVLSVQRPLQQWKTRPDLPIHVELTSMQRPNPWHDGRDCISGASYNISQNYMLHIHPVKSTIKNANIIHEQAETLRTTDTTYGAAARAALFGFQDFVFLKNETKIGKNRRKAKQIPTIIDS